MPSASRMLRILGLFDLGRPVITPEWLMAELGVSCASIYRDLGQLAQAGMLEKVANRGYVLGPKLVELDRQIRLADRLLEAADELLEQLASQTGGTVLLCRFHGSKVMFVQQVNGRNPALSVSYERGRAMPLYRGATSKIILACLPQPQLRHLPTSQNHTRAPAKRRQPHRRSAPRPVSESARQQKGRHCMNASSSSSAGRISLN